MNDPSIQPIKQSDLAAETSVFTLYLKQLGLPTDNVIASNDERSIITSNLSFFMSTLSAESKKDARYLSKFVGATAIGLFDAALNFVWNEVVLNLRKKASIYGIDPGLFRSRHTGKVGLTWTWNSSIGTQDDGPASDYRSFLRTA